MTREQLTDLESVLPTSLDAINHWLRVRLTDYKDGWLLTVNGRHSEFATMQDALIWLSAYCLKLAHVPEKEPS